MRRTGTRECAPGAYEHYGALFILNDMDLIAHTIRAVYERKGYRFFDDGKPYNLNIFGIRNPDGLNEWSDFLCVLYRNERYNWQLFQTPATTKSGLQGLRKPVNKSGTGTLVPGQYLGIYRIDLHNGKHAALCQRNGPVKVYRDNNMDNVFDLKPEAIQEGLFGVNIHSPFSDAPTVDGRSVACQVPSTVAAWNIILKLAQKSAELYGNSFTYTLFDASDFSA